MVELASRAGRSDDRGVTLVMDRHDAAGPAALIGAVA